jgi:hypothetical protein
MICRGARAPRTPPRRRSLGLGASLRSGGALRFARAFSFVAAFD